MIHPIRSPQPLLEEVRADSITPTLQMRKRSWLCHVAVWWWSPFQAILTWKLRWDVFSFPRSSFSLRGRQCYPHLTQGCCRTNEKALTLTSRVTLSHPLTHSLFSFCFFHYAGHEASPTACRWTLCLIFIGQQPCAKRFSYAIFYLQLQIWSSSINDLIKNKCNKTRSRNLQRVQYTPAACLNQWWDLHKSGWEIR